MQLEKSKPDDESAVLLVLEADLWTCCVRYLASVDRLSSPPAADNQLARRLLTYERL